MLRFLSFVALLFAVVSCKGRRSIDVEPNEFADGKHPAKFDAFYASLRDCLNAQFEGVAHSDAPLDSVAKVWIIKGKYDAPGCERKDGSIAGGCVNGDTVKLAEHALQSWTIPVHEMGHSWQQAAHMPLGADGGSIHGPKFTHCTEEAPT